MQKAMQTQKRMYLDIPVSSGCAPLPQTLSSVQPVTKLATGSLLSPGLYKLMAAQSAASSVSYKHRVKAEVTDETPIYNRR